MQGTLILTFSRRKHNLLIGVDVTETAGVEAFELTLQVCGDLGEVFQGGSVTHGAGHCESINNKQEIDLLL